MRFIALIFFVAQICFSAGIGFDFVDARKKGYTDKEILDYVAKNVNGYDISALRSAKLSDKEIVDFFIQRDSVSSQIIALQKSSFGDGGGKSKVYPEEVSTHLALGCRIYIGKVKQQNDGWSYIAKLTDFAKAAYTTAYLTEANYFDINNAQGVNLKDICGAWLDKLNTKEEIKKLYALSLVKEITSLVKQKKALVID